MFGEEDMKAQVRILLGLLAFYGIPLVSNVSSVCVDVNKKYYSCCSPFEIKLNYSDCFLCSYVMLSM